MSIVDESGRIGFTSNRVLRKNGVADTDHRIGEGVGTGCTPRRTARPDVLRHSTARKDQQRENDGTRTKRLNMGRHGNTSA